MKEIKFRCWFDNKMHRVEDVSFRGNTINLFAADIIKFEDGILMQYIGLKDKNGKEIYEGDIIGYIDWDGKMRVDGVIKYGEYNCSCCNGVYGWYVDEGDIRGIEGYEVIGNIYDNPELLEKV